MTKTNSDNARSLTAEGIKLALLSTWRFDYELLNLAQSVADQIVQPNTKAKIVSAIVVSGFGNNIVEEAVVGPFEVDVPRGFSYRSGRLRREYPLNTRDREIASLTTLAADAYALLGGGSIVVRAGFSRIEGESREDLYLAYGRPPGGEFVIAVEDQAP